MEFCVESSLRIRHKIGVGLLLLFITRDSIFVIAKPVRAAAIHFINFKVAGFYGIDGIFTDSVTIFA